MRYSITVVAIIVAIARMSLPWEVRTVLLDASTTRFATNQ